MADNHTKFGSFNTSYDSLVGTGNFVLSVYFFKNWEL